MLEKGLTNYWGYNSIGFLAPDPRYAREAREVVARIQGDGRAPSMTPAWKSSSTSSTTTPPKAITSVRRSLSKASTTPLLSPAPDQKRYYINDTGTGNTVNLSHRPRHSDGHRQSALLGEQTHVDGFRFDLGTILAREPNGFDNQSGFLKACSQDPFLAP